MKIDYTLCFRGQYRNYMDSDDDRRSMNSWVINEKFYYSSTTFIQAAQMATRWALADRQRRNSTVLNLTVPSDEPNPIAARIGALQGWRYFEHEDLNAAFGITPKDLP
jgi:hypothetical protein